LRAVAEARAAATASLPLYCGPGTPVFLITVFGKGEKANLTRGEANELAQLVKRLCATYGK
jgi:hypothetical protein